MTPGRDPPIDLEYQCVIRIGRDDELDEEVTRDAEARGEFLGDRTELRRPKVACDSGWPGRMRIGDDLLACVARNQLSAPRRRQVIPNRSGNVCLDQQPRRRIPEVQSLRFPELREGASDLAQVRAYRDATSRESVRALHDHRVAVRAC